ncbi:MAG TPA: protein phosphatase 2C domain-containing protein [Anaerolineales bacterium]|nr:protein phosphatase 2C domain-containing protein [Anaerolineales bacterium]
MEFIRRLFGKKTTPPPDQASTAPLDPDKVPYPYFQELHRHITTGTAQSIGVERKKNDDSLLVIVGSADGDNEPPDFGLLCVADGLGGYEHGAHASAISVRTLASSLTRGAILDLLALEPEGQTGSLEDIVRLAVQQANREVRSRAEGGATTLTTALVVGEQVTIGHVGDTRAYFITEDGIQQLTRDHSLVQELVDTGTITEEEALTHPQRNVLWNSMGKAIDVKVDVATHTTPPDGYLLLCSDGLWGVVADDVIRDTVLRMGNPQQACEALVAAANAAGGPDNVTCIAAYFPARVKTAT